MKILIHHGTPFQLAHGGHQTQIEKTKEGLEAAGCEVEWLRWWDEEQEADLIHAFSPVEVSALIHAQRVETPVVLTSLLGWECNFSSSRIRFKVMRRKILNNLTRFQSRFRGQAGREYHLCARNIVGLEAERNVLHAIHGVPLNNISVVPLGLPQQFLSVQKGDRNGDYLVSHGTITERKNSVELAKLARDSKVPILFIGKPYHLDDPYWKRFERLIDNRWVRHQNHVPDTAALIDILRTARGFILMSAGENWCLAAHEAAACGLPLLLPRMNWSLERFGDQAQYLEAPGSTSNNEILQRFYHQSTTLPSPQIRQWSWKEAAQQLLPVYEHAISSIRSK